MQEKDCTELERLTRLETTVIEQQRQIDKCVSAESFRVLQVLCFSALALFSTSAVGLLMLVITKGLR